MDSVETRPLATRVMKARRRTVCPVCHGTIQVGAWIALTDEWQHVGHVVAFQRNVADVVAAMKDDGETNTAASTASDGHGGEHSE